MKKNDIKELHQLTETDLVKKLSEMIKTFDQSRSENAAGKLKNTSSIYQLKKDIARVKTVIREKTLQAVAETAVAEKAEKVAA
ncbi:MAG: 50S ribosomal protein L29 [Patescibacteria group bacterium]